MGNDVKAKIEELRKAWRFDPYATFSEREDYIERVFKPLVEDNARLRAKLNGIAEAVKSGAENTSDRGAYRMIPHRKWESIVEAAKGVDDEQ
jgi:hypothetical protein